MNLRLEYLRNLWNNRADLRQATLALALWGITAVLLFPKLGYPRQISFDETYMIPRAQRYLQGIFFQESHPPLGRLAIALGQILVHPNDRPDEFALVEKVNKTWPQDQDMTGYRLIPALFGTLIPVLAYLILTKLLGSQLYSFVLSLFLAFDNALLTQAHFALSDSILIGFCLSSILVFLHLDAGDPAPERSTRILWLIWGIVTAAATLVKFSSWFVLILVPIYGLKLLPAGQRRQLISFGATFALGFVLTWVTIWQIHFSLVPELDPNNDYEISAVHRDILEGRFNPDPIGRFFIQLRDALGFISHYHEGVPNLDLTKPGEIGSAWYQWPLGGRAMSYRWETPDGTYYRYIYLLGNPATWLISLLGVLSGTGLAISDLLFRFLPDERRRGIYLFTLLYWGYMIPAMFVERVLYLYHYLPPMILGVFLFGLVITEATRPTWRTKRAILVFAMVCVLAGFWVYKPFTYYEPLTNEQFQQRDIWPVWDLHCATCSGDGGG